MAIQKKIDVNQISNFRNFINGNSHFVLNKYRNIDGKNKWSIICSCIDWTTVAVDYINSVEMKNENENIMSMQVYSIISAYDIIVDSIIQLHRVFFNTKESPFQSDRLVFNEKLTDEEYFKHIRAVFGAHPVNLSDVITNDGNKKYYASWSTTRGFSGKDIHVYLYSNLPGETAIEFGINFLDINKFAIKYYNHLNEIIKEITDQYNKFLFEKKGQLIVTQKDTIAQILLLKKENKERINSDYYGYCLDKLEMMFSANCTLDENKAAFSEYLIQLKKVVLEINNNLQDMLDCELKTSNIINPPLPIGKHYDYEKVFGYIYGGDDYISCYMFPHHYQRILEDLSEVKAIDANSGKSEILLLINTGLFFSNNFEDRE